MDIEALRARALETKKRKRARPDTAQAGPGANLPPAVVTLDDLEEGEIDDGPPAIASAAATVAASNTSSSHTTGHGAGMAAMAPSIHGPGSMTGLPPSLGSASSASATTVKEQSKRVIAELLSYGVPPAYLVSIGVSRQLLAVAFDELGLHLALPALPPSPIVPPASAVASTSAPRSPLPLMTDAELADLEARKRQELLARKAALLARNQQSAQSLESELESLFSAGPIDLRHGLDLGSPPEVDPAETAAALALAKRKKKQQLKWARKKRKLDAAAEPFDPAGSGDAGGNLFSSLQDERAQAIHDLRESLDHTEELVKVPPEGPFASTSSGVGTSSLSAASTSRFPETATGSAPRRPTATEFEHDPTVRLSTNSLMKGRRGRAFIADEPVRMVIDISDTEDEGGGDDDDDRGGQRESSDERTTAATSSMPGTAASTRAPTLASSRRSPPDSTRSRQGSPSNGTDKIAAEIARRQQLEEKENAIKRMMERIAEIERRKKEGSKERGTASTSMSRTPSVSNETAPTPALHTKTAASSESAAPPSAAPIAPSAIETVKVLS